MSSYHFMCDMNKTEQNVFILLPVGDLPHGALVNAQERDESSFFSSLIFLKISLEFPEEREEQRQRIL